MTITAAAMPGELMSRLRGIRDDLVDVAARLRAAASMTPQQSAELDAALAEFDAALEDDPPA